MQISPSLTKKLQNPFIGLGFLKYETGFFTLCVDFLWCALFAWFFSPFIRAPFILTGMEYSWGGYSLQKTATHLRCVLGTDLSSKDFMKKLDTNSRTSQISPRLKSTKRESCSIYSKPQVHWL